MAKAKFYNAEGSYQAEIDLPVDLFEAEISEGSVYLTVKAYLAAQRQGTHKAQCRSDVTGSGAKPFKQKGTGRARQGNKNSPIWVRGAKAHGPKPHKYHDKVNKKVRRKALLSALTSKAQASSIHVIEALSFEAPKTKQFLSLMKNAQLGPGRVLCLAAESDANLLKSAGNVPWATIMRVQDVNTYALLRADDIVFSKAALAQLTGGTAA